MQRQILKLTLADQGSEVYIFVDHIISMQPIKSPNGGVLINCTRSSYQVKQSIDQVLQYLEVQYANRS